MPYSIVASTTEVTNAAGKKVAGRAYPWGNVEIENDAHCDFRKLRSLLIRYNYLLLFRDIDGC